MDQDDFNDFQTSAPPTQPEHPPTEQDLPQLSHHTQSVAQPTTNQQPPIKLQPSYSLDVNVPSQQAQEYDSIDWEGSAWPNLGKMESDHMGALEHSVPDFSKKNSQGEAQEQPNNSPRQQVFSNGQQEVKQNYSNSATLHSNLYQDFDFGFTTKLHHEPRSHSPESLPEKKEPISPKKIEHEHSETRQKEQRQANRLDKRQDDEEDEFNDYGTAEARKQSQNFEYQDAVEPQHENNIHQAHKQVVQTQNDYHSEPDHNEAEEKQQADPEEDFLQYHISQPAQDFHNIEYAPQEPIQKLQQAPKQEEDDQFGDFEQIVQNAEELHVNGVSKSTEEKQSSEVVQAYRQSTNGSNQIRIDASKAPYDMEVLSRQKQLQKFVDNLPDYGFLLVKAFNTL